MNRCVRNETRKPATAKPELYTHIRLHYVVATAKALADAVLARSRAASSQPPRVTTSSFTRHRFGGPTSVEGKLKLPQQCPQARNDRKNPSSLRAKTPRRSGAKADYWRQTFKPWRVGEEALVKRLRARPRAPPRSAFPTSSSPLSMIRSATPKSTGSETKGSDSSNSNACSAPIA